MRYLRFHTMIQFHAMIICFSPNYVWFKLKSPYTKNEEIRNEKRNFFSWKHHKYSENQYFLHIFYWLSARTESDLITFFTVYGEKLVETKTAIRGPLKHCRNEKKWGIRKACWYYYRLEIIRTLGTPPFCALTLSWRRPLSYRN